MAKSKPVSKPKSLSLELKELERAALSIRAISHNVRQQILNLIHDKGEIRVSDIYARLRLEQSLTSAYLATLRKANLVKTRREGQSIYYSVNYDHLSQMQKGAKIINAWSL